MPTFYLENFGCRATQADGAAIERQFQARGLDRASSAASAALVILNTCTVTASADQDARAAIRRIRRENPGCEIVVTGCYAQRAPEEVAALPGVSRVIGNSHKHRLAEIVLLHSGTETSTRAAAFVPLSALGSVNRELTTAFRPPATEEFYLLVLQGGMAIGATVWGALAQRIGVPDALTVAAVVLALGVFALRGNRITASELELAPAVIRD